ncbi:putative transposase [Microlunatus phosphovorus NM-1]|uniref:Putative transposase n=1 Tax=Microlunatus phosphovorus (strain ATCC 700054 / DSM 10555 / JCM 9379 / NBRC 101784 / NCIMB 13414 / VKM Ac-1990 / NM-1) TaxID=1032480 RepID=F5XII1_MICPN|nr:putative transposase [Microlunatus phosphovorus NM-1]
MGAVGTSADNSLAESFNATLNARSCKITTVGPTRRSAAARCSAGSCATTPAADTPTAATRPRPPTRQPLGFP